MTKYSDKNILSFIQGLIRNKTFHILLGDNSFQVIYLRKCYSRLLWPKQNCKICEQILICLLYVNDFTIYVLSCHSTNHSYFKIQQIHWKVGWKNTLLKSSVSLTTFVCFSHYERIIPPIHFWINKKSLYCTKLKFWVCILADVDV